MSGSVKMIVGLGNPGADYRLNRHNIGYRILDALAEATHASVWQKKFKGFLAKAEIEGQTLLLIKPSTYMNLSGESVGEALRYFKLDPADVVVFHDDIDLLPGDVRVKQGGGHAGHNGLRSLDAHIGKDYWRVRIGVGRPAHKNQVSDFVLGNFNKDDLAWIEALEKAVPEGLAKLLAGDGPGFVKAVTPTA